MDGDNEYNLVVGLPIGQFKSQKDKLVKMILGYNNCEIIYKGKEMNIKINNVYPLPQSIGALLSLKDVSNNAIIFDWGGLTIDIAYIEFNNGNPILIKFDTWTQGIQTIYGKLINKVNEKYNLTREISFAENILVNGLLIDGAEVSLDFLVGTIREYIEPIVTEFRLNYPASNVPIYLTGGVSTIQMVVDLFKIHFPHSKVMPNGQFANAIGYGKVAEQKFDNIVRPVYMTCRR
jgi:plasmid segregation protein ParM